MGEFTQFSKKKIKINKRSEPVSCKVTALNPGHHCSADPMARGGPRLVRLINFFFNKIQTEKIIIKKYFVNPFHGIHWCWCRCPKGCLSTAYTWICTLSLSFWVWDYHIWVKIELFLAQCFLIFVCTTLYSLINHVKNLN